MNNNADLIKEIVNIYEQAGDYPPASIVVKEMLSVNVGMNRLRELIAAAGKLTHIPHHKNRFSMRICPCCKHEKLMTTAAGKCSECQELDIKVKRSKRGIDQNKKVRYCRNEGCGKKITNGNYLFCASCHQNKSRADCGTFGRIAMSGGALA